MANAPDPNRVPVGINSQEEFEEFVKCKMDPLYFLDNYAYTLNPIKGKVPFKLYDFQKRCINDFRDYVFNIILKPRQMGLSWLTAGYVLWLAIFHSEKNILMISIKENAAKRLLDKVKYIYANLPNFLKPGYDEWVKTSIVFKNGSRIDSIPTSEDAGRSESVSLLVIDEAAFVRWIDEIWAAAFPTLSTGGQAILLSTANGMGNFFHQTWAKALKTYNDFHAILLHWRDHPDRDDKWYLKQLRNLGKRRCAQEVDCDFLQSGSPVFEMAKVRDLEESLIDVPNKILRTDYNDSLLIYHEPEFDGDYVIGADVASGGGEDYSTFYVYDRINKRICAQFKQRLPVDRYAAILNKIGLEYNTALLAVESNNHGLAVLVQLNLTHKYPNLFCRYDLIDNEPTQKLGWETNVKTKAVVIAGLDKAIRDDELTGFTSEFLQECYTYAYEPNGATNALDGYHDDLIMALAITLEASKSRAKILDLPMLFL